MRSVLVIANPAAGSVSPGLPGAVARAVAARGATVQVVCTEGPDHARKLAAEAVGPVGPHTVISLGGDGTLNEVTHGLVDGTEPKHRPALLVLPGGTGNSVHRELWGDRSWQATLDDALAGAHVRRIDLMREVVSGRLAVLGACSGVVAQALVTARTLTGVHGRDRYALAVAETLRTFHPYPGRVTVDGEIIHQGPTVFANVGGGRDRGGRFRLLPYSVLDDGLLDVCVVGGGLLNSDLPRLAIDGSHAAHPEAVYARGRRITVERTDSQPLVFEHDGELAEDARPAYTFTVLPAALPVLGPAEIRSSSEPGPGGAPGHFPAR